MFNNVYVVSGSAKKMLEGASWMGLFFREAVLNDASSLNKPDVLWEIDSKIELPQMSNSFINPHSVVPCHFIEDRPYRNGEPHYREPDLLPLGAFDIARTLERLGSDQGLIISQRFYRFCLEHAMSLEVRPVRIDPELASGTLG
jgi:hypothetical protein